MNEFELDYPRIKLSKYFMTFLEKICHKNNFLVYYNPSSSNFIISDNILNQDYKYYKTSQQINELDNSFQSKDFKWKQKNILLFDKEEPYEQNDGEYYYPDYYECNHNIDFKLSLINLQTILLNIFKNPILSKYSYSIQELFYISDINTYFPSKNLMINPELDLLLVKNLDQRLLIECLTNKNSHQKSTLLEHLKKQNDNYLIEFFKIFSQKDFDIKDTIFDVSNNQNLLENIIEYFPKYQKYLLKNTPNNFLTKTTEEITINKIYFNIDALGIIYHEKFKVNDIQNILVDILNNSSTKKILNEKNLILHHTYFDYHSQSVISIIENNSKINTNEFENFIKESFNHLEKENFSNKNNIEKFKKFWNYFYQSTILKEPSPKKTITNKI